MPDAGGRARPKIPIDVEGLPPARDQDPSLPGGHAAGVGNGRQIGDAQVLIAVREQAEDRQHRGLEIGDGHKHTRIVGGDSPNDRSCRKDCCLPGVSKPVCFVSVCEQDAITADTALRLGRWLGTGPELWLNLQTQYELRLAEQQVGQEIRQTITPVPSREDWPAHHISK